MRSRRWVVALVSAVGAIGACSTFGVSTDTAADGGADAPAPPPPPAPADGAPEDAARDDASSTDAADGGGFVGAPCDGGMHVFCDDFDTNPTLVGWTLFQQDGGTVAVQDAVDAPTPPKVLVASAPMNVKATIDRQSPLSSAGVACSFDARISAQDVQGDLLSFALDAPGAYYHLELRLAGGGGTDALYEYGQYPDGGALSLVSTTVPLPTGAWHHVAFEIRFGAGSGFAFHVDGPTVISHPAYDLTPMPAPSVMAWSLGVQTLGAPDGGVTSVEIDDVVCDPIP